MAQNHVQQTHHNQAAYAPPQMGQPVYGQPGLNNNNYNQWQANNVKVGQENELMDLQKKND